MNAPALEKGLDVMETLVARSDSLTLSKLAEHCGRRVSEIQRMVHVLHRRGYIERTESNAYRPGLKLYELGRFRHPFRHLQTVAEPIMAGVAEQTGHSIHLSVEDGGQMLILSEILGTGVAAVALKVGSRHALSETLSGRILALNHPGVAKASDSRHINTVGFLHLKSRLYAGVEDLGVPVYRPSDQRIVAVLASNWLVPRKGSVQVEQVAGILHEAAARISRRIQEPDRAKPSP